MAAGAPGATAENDWFIGASLGLQSFDTGLDVDEGTIDLLFDPDDDGQSISVELGRRLSPNWTVALEYSFVDADTVEFDNWLGSIDRHWQLNGRWQVFAGVVVGDSTLDWQEAPVDTRNRERKSEDFLWGLQTGANFILSDEISLRFRYQFLSPEHVTRLQPRSGDGEYRHEEFHHISVGLRVHF